MLCVQGTRNVEKTGNCLIELRCVLDCCVVKEQDANDWMVTSASPSPGLALWPLGFGDARVAFLLGSVVGLPLFVSLGLGFYVSALDRRPKMWCFSKF